MTTKKKPERLHGAFTGGFSAGFFNSVGSAEGWTPSTFASSRDKRAAPRQQRPEDFMDDEDELLTEELQARPEFDALGFTANEVARKQAEGEHHGASIPGSIPSELIIPVGDSMGKKLLRTMGWKEGQGVGSRVRRRRKRLTAEQGQGFQEDMVPEAAMAGLGDKARELIMREGLTLAPENTEMPVRKMIAKSTLHGVGHDPFKNAPEFKSSRLVGEGDACERQVYRTGDLREAKDGPKSMPKTGLAPHIVSGRGSSGFAIDDAEDDVYEKGAQDTYDTVLDAEVDMAAKSGLTGRAEAWARSESKEDPVVSRKYARCRSDGRLPPSGFVVAQKNEAVQKFWPPPIPPGDFHPRHKFVGEEEASIFAKYLQRGRKGTGIDSKDRAKMLGEPEVVQSPARDSSLYEEGTGTSHANEDTSIFTLMSSSARKKIRDAASRCNSTTEDAAALSAVLASKFTPASTPRQEDASATRFSSRPAGLSVLSTTSPQDESAKLQEESRGRARKEVLLARKPVRSVMPWRPAPLLCKRLNVPTPASSAEVDWTKTAEASKSGSGRDEFLEQSHGQQGQNSREKKRNPDVEVGLLAQMGQDGPQRSGSRVPAPTDTGSTSGMLDVERPPVDLFKSIFESESESDSEDEDRSSPSAIASTKDAKEPAAAHEPVTRDRNPQENLTRSRQGGSRMLGRDSGHSDEDEADPVDATIFPDGLSSREAARLREKSGHGVPGHDAWRSNRRDREDRDRDTSERDIARQRAINDGSRRDKDRHKRSGKHKHKKEKSHSKKHKKHVKSRKSNRK